MLRSLLWSVNLVKIVYVLLDIIIYQHFHSCNHLGVMTTNKDDPCKDLLPIWIKKVDESPSNVPGTCRKPITIKQENAHHSGERNHYSIVMFFLPASFGTFWIIVNALLYHQKSYRHPALRGQAMTCVVYDDWPILDCKSTKKFWKEQKRTKKIEG